MNWPATGAILLALAVILGAFGAHSLRDHLDAYSMSIWEKAVFYHFIHALGILLSGALFPKGGSRVSILLFAGIVLFSGSLYTLALTGQRYLGAVTPFGGIAFIAAWVCLAIQLIRRV